MSAYIDEHRAGFGVEPICQTLGVSASAYYERRQGERCERALEDERLLSVIEDLHARKYCAYGYRRMWKALRRAGEQVGHDRVRRLMRSAGIQGAKRRGRPWRTTKSDPADVSEPRSDRSSLSSRSPRLPVGRRSDLPALLGGLVFFAFVIDVFSRRVVGWQLATHMRASLVTDALRMALPSPLVARSARTLSVSTSTPARRWSGLAVAVEALPLWVLQARGELGQKVLEWC
ncbi:MAG: IS3 family transposase [Actinomycetota bacterium]|nr:IS3 family transposase [Actinomycetota bacterium]